MFFEKEYLSFEFLDVYELNQRNVNMINSGRPFNALSFRFRSDTVLKTQTEQYHMKDNFVSYVPSNLGYSRISKYDKLIAVHFNASNYVTRNIEFFDPKNPEVIAKLFVEILDCWNKKEVGYKYKCASILNRIFEECYAQNFVFDYNTSKIQRSVDHILENYKDSNLRIKDAADRSFVSEVYFRKLFKKEYGVSPQKYIIDLRIKNAVELISKGYYSLTEIAHMSGYNDYKYFSVEFKKVMGVSPSEYSYNYEKNK